MMTARGLVARLAEGAGIPRYRAGFMVRALVVELREELARGGAVTISGLGTFRRARRPAHLIRDVNTGDEKVMGSRWTPVFRPSRTLRAHVVKPG